MHSIYNILIGGLLLCIEYPPFIQRECSWIALRQLSTIHWTKLEEKKKTKTKLKLIYSTILLCELCARYVFTQYCGVCTSPKSLVKRFFFLLLSIFFPFHFNYNSNRFGCMSLPRWMLWAHFIHSNFLLFYLSLLLLLLSLSILISNVLLCFVVRVCIVCNGFVCYLPSHLFGCVAHFVFFFFYSFAISLSCHIDGKYVLACLLYHWIDEFSISLKTFSTSILLYAYCIAYYCAQCTLFTVSSLGECIKYTLRGIH